MSDFTLVIGNKNYSSWSLRPWLAMRMAGIPFREVRIPLYTPDSSAALSTWSPSGRVPLLQDGTLKVWESLAIGEYLAERFPDAGLWPRSREARAVARSVSAEMHSGFAALRSAMPMNIRQRHPDSGRTPECLRDIGRVLAIWRDCRARFGEGGNFLFGRFSIADAMYAPVVLRFRTYGVALDGAAKGYADAVMALPALQEWVADAEQEAESIPKFDRYDGQP